MTVTLLNLLLARWQLLLSYLQKKCTSDSWYHGVWLAESHTVDFEYQLTVFRL